MSGKGITFTLQSAQLPHNKEDQRYKRPENVQRHFRQQVVSSCPMRLMAFLLLGIGVKSFVRSCSHLLRL
jgi:hypothetical protein